jgi:hypothetical protein
VGVEDYPGDEVFCTCKMGLAFRTAVDFNPVEVSEILETLYAVISRVGMHDRSSGYHYVSLNRITATQ